MKPEGENILFDPVDRSRYPKLPEWKPIEAAPGLYLELCEAQDDSRLKLDAAQSCDVMDIPEHVRLHKLAAAYQRLHDLEILKTQLGRIAPDAIAAVLPLEEVVGLPGVGLNVLDQK